jgi:hypothetical protein
VQVIQGCKKKIGQKGLHAAQCQPTLAPGTLLSALPERFNAGEACDLPLRWALLLAQRLSPTELVVSVLLPERSAFGGLATLS